MRRTRACLLAIPLALLFTAGARGDERLPAEQVAFFEKHVRPVLVTHCYRCHSASADEIAGNLRLDFKSGWQAGGDSGAAAIVPGNPDDSPFIRAIRHMGDESPMPPNQAKLPERVINDLVTWVEMGAPDPRDGQPAKPHDPTDWERIYQERLNWWSLHPVAKPQPPAVKQSAWTRNEVDAFVLAALEENKLKPVAEVDPRLLARRLSFVLTGLPPSNEVVEAFAADPSPSAYQRLVQSLLDSPHFGEHWARHWMDVVHYADTHGYEWDAPAKNAWMYRDYLIRAFNSDLPYDRFVMEQLAGDLIDTRVDAATGLNETLIAPMALRLGERRHGDNVDTEGTTQEAIANVIDTVGKGFLGTTIACAQCHDHKLDAIGQQDYYALAGLFMSTRWSVRTVDTVDPNVAIIAELKEIKRQIRAQLAAKWLGSKEQLIASIPNLLREDNASTGFPDSLGDYYRRSLASPVAPDEFAQETARRADANRENLTLIADFTQHDGANGWRWDGFGMTHGLVQDGELVVSDEGQSVLAHVLPAGRWSHAWSPHLAGALRSPLLEKSPPKTLSIGLAAGQHAAESFIIDQAYHCERMQFLNKPQYGWLTLTAGNFRTLEGGVDQANRRVYLELVTKALNNYYPPRVKYGGLKEEDEADPRSWFGVTQIYEHPPGSPPQDELARFAPLFDDPADWPTRLANLLLAAVERWSNDKATAEDVALINDALTERLLANDMGTAPELKQLVEQYRTTAARLTPDRVIGSADDWLEAHNERVGIRGSYTDFGDEVPRGGIRSLGGPTNRAVDASTGRLEFARGIASANNPLTARVYVNRVWQHLFGEGLVRTPDDFGHLGELPSHPELLDYLATRFVEDGWSTKRLITLLVMSSTFRQSSIAGSDALALDPENRLLHHMSLRRLEAESIRDAMLTASGRLDDDLYGPPLDPHRTAQDASKRLFSGPLDGNGRRSLYTKVTLMDPPRFMAIFNQPLPKLTTGRRDVTNVPDQALALLNDPLVIALSKHWSERVLGDGSTHPETRVRTMFASAMSRPPEQSEVDRLLALAARSAELRGVDSAVLLDCGPVWQDVAHAIFNLKEFIHVR